MQIVAVILVLALSSYFVEWIPNNATTTQSSSQSPGEFPWQL